MASYIMICWGCVAVQYARLLEMLAQGKSKEDVLGTHIKSSACYGSIAPRMMCIMNLHVGLVVMVAKACLTDTNGLC